MNTRPSRSSSIPIPRSSSSSGANRNIESLISIPQYGSPSRPQRHNAQRLHLSQAFRSTASGSNPSVSLTQIPRSASTSVSGRNSTQPSFEPRIIRGSGTEIQPSSGSECPPSQPQLSTSHSQTRRASLTNLRTSNKSQLIARPTAVTFSRPAYLEYSSLRHLLQAEVPVSPLSSRRADSSITTRSQPYSVAMSPSSDIDDDSNATPPPHDLRPPPPSLPLAAQDTPFRLPTRWGADHHHPDLILSLDGRELTYEGASFTGEKDAAAARTAHPIPPACGVYYFEIEILGKEQKAHVSLGFTGRSVKFTRLPGWEANSWGYYGDDGHALSADKSGASYGPPFGTGDVVGCGIDFTTYKAFFTKNGTLIGPVFDNIGRNVGLYPAIGLRHMREVVRANFGQEPFKYDIDYHVQQQLNVTWTKILSTSLDSTLLRLFRKTGPASIASITNDTFEKTSISDEESKLVLNQLVMTYLIHHGYAKTARALEISQQKANELVVTGSPSRSDTDIEMRHSTNKSGLIESDIECRTSIVNHVLGGKIDLGIEAIQNHYPKVLETDDHLIFFKLRCRKFVELILETSEIKRKIKALRERDDRSQDPEKMWIDDEMNMDIDGDASRPLPYRSSSNESLNNTASSYSAPDGEDAGELEDLVAQYETALNEAINYGQTLSKNHQSDPRPELQELFKKTFGIVAWEDPLEAGGSIADIVGHNSRIALAHEVNQAILKSQGRPVQPALETVYRHTSTCVTQLGLLGVGAAAFADMSREFLQV